MAFTVPGYQVDQLLGFGSHAEVWSGRAVATGEPVALKRIVLPGSAGPDRIAELVQAARAEAALLTVLEHPSLVRLHRYVQTPAAAVLVMELAEGGSLAQLLRRRNRLTPAEVAAALSPVAAALAFAHAEGVLHGDVSAANILFTAAGHAKLADLGVARMLFGPTGPDRVLGTPAYVDPVLAAGGTAGPFSDVFSLAAVALHCLTGAGPWQGDGPGDLPAVLARAATGVIENLDARLATCPPAMAAVLRRALDPEPHRRGSAAELALDLGASVPRGPVVLAAGRIAPGVGRHSVERHAPAATDAVPADLTHVARLQIRPEPAAPMPERSWRRRLAVPALVAGVLLAGTVTATAAARGGWPGLAAGPHRSAPPAPEAARTRAANPGPPAGPAKSASSATSGATAVAIPSAGSAGPVRPAGSAGFSVPATASGRADGDPAPDDPDPAALLRRLADRRAAAFAANRPELLAGVYQSPELLAEDAALLGSRVPAGCGLAGLRTGYTDVTVTSSTGKRIEVQVTASQPSATLLCDGTVRSRTLPAAPARLAVTLVRVGEEFRIAGQRASS
ncbi:serine/threonine-protein kinase [Jatrophihabitans sp.]|uniref:serine/threonine-protein kinase n=1 Tax=Jatrophihabitans sp. TaxID=1932789 RepID=UPI002B6F6BBF|nr:protein kinase [Jatrophihabitans sp.]